MRLDEVAGPNGQSSPQSLAKIAGVFYLLTFSTGILALVLRGTWSLASGLTAGACYIAVTLVFYRLFKPVSGSLSWLAAFISLAGIAIGPLSRFHLLPFQINPLVFFGFYCLLIGYLILRSLFLPRVLGLLMVIAGLGWLTYLSPALAKALSPYNMIPGIVGEGVLTLWLLAVGVDAPRWKEQNVAGGRAIVASPGGLGDGVHGSVRSDSHRGTPGD